jgi:hypothetical protein
MTTFLASIRRAPLTSFPSITVPAVVMVFGPVYAVRVVPAGTPVLVAPGFPELGVVTVGDAVGDAVAVVDGLADGFGVLEAVALGVVVGVLVGFSAATWASSLSKRHAL